MRTHIEFRTSEPLVILLRGRNTFGGIAIKHHLGKVVDDGMYIETFDLFVKNEVSTPSLLASLAGDMYYWRDYRKVTSVDDLYELIANAIQSYTSDDLSKCMKWDDFDDYLVLLFTVVEIIRRGKIHESDIQHFNINDIDEMRW